MDEETIMKTISESDKEELDISDLEDLLFLLKKKRSSMRKEILKRPQSEKEELLSKIKHSQEDIRLMEQYPSTAIILRSLYNEIKNMEDSNNLDKSFPFTKYSLN